MIHSQHVSEGGETAGIEGMCVAVVLMAFTLRMPLKVTARQLRHNVILPPFPQPHLWPDPSLHEPLENQAVNDEEALP